MEMRVSKETSLITAVGFLFLCSILPCGSTSESACWSLTRLSRAGMVSNFSRFHERRTVPVLDSRGSVSSAGGSRVAVNLCEPNPSACHLPGTALSTLVEVAFTPSSAAHGGSRTCPP